MLPALQPLARFVFFAIVALGVASTSAVQSGTDSDSDPFLDLSTPTARTADSRLPNPADAAVDSGLTAGGSELLDAVVEGAATGLRPAGAGVGGEAAGVRLLRICRVTAYCDRGTTAAGVPSGVGQCAAPSYIPFGSRIHIPALGRTFVVTDRTHRRFRNSTVDIFMPSKEDCRRFGRRFLECEIVIEPPDIRRTLLARS